MVLSFRSFSPMRYAATKSIILSNYLQFNLHVQTDDVLSNPVNPDLNYVIRKGVILRNLLSTHHTKNLKNRVNA
jgi:hypothetical protein